ncbi:uncharacterized protein BDV14DRAFT_189000 [Aspergillus stella-maris]|uniref:uncharacterized protein n=1 Tax=Aspergillus stella-maris TaxID=1810926 RepID=UPI003CCDA8B3
MMRAVFFSGVPFNVYVGGAPIPTIQNQTDVVVRVTAAAICGSDLHMYRGTGAPSSSDPVIIGHEAMGVVAEVGDGVNFLSVGDYVPESYRAYGAPDLPGSQAEYVRVPFADHGLIPVPNPDDSTEPLLDYLFLSDIFPTAWTSLDYAGFEPGDTVAIFGAGPVGLLAVYSAMLRGASRVYAVDSVPSGLELAASIGAIPISFNTSDPVQQILEYEPNGVRRSVDCVGYEAVNATFSPDASLVNGGLGVVGVYPSTIYSPTTGNGHQKTKSLQLSSGAVNPMDTAPRLQDLITTGVARPSFITKVVIRFP